MATSAWARRRQLLYGGGLLFFFVLVIVPTIFFYVYEPPSCFDGKMNQTETDIDRGGPCTLLDARYLQPHAVLWSRSFPVRDGFYNAVAYIENPNSHAGVKNAIYQFKLYDERNILIAERFGQAPIVPEKVFPIFEGRIDTGNRIPVRTTFGFVNVFTWEKMVDETSGLRVRNERVSDLTTAPRVSAELTNTTVAPVEDLVVIATLFDGKSNAFASARTVVERIDAGETKTLVFTWPEPFTANVARVDIIPLAARSATQ